MQPIIYDVAVSIDGFISGPDDDISAFPQEGPIVDDYFDRLSNYQHTIMARGTYKFGYKFGLKAGQNPYPHMETLVFSSSLKLPENSAVEIVSELQTDRIMQLKSTAKSPIYLCGGGKFAGWMLNHGLIDVLRLKRAPIILGHGTPIFSGEIPNIKMNCKDTKVYEGGFLLQEFDLL